MIRLGRVEFNAHTLTLGCYQLKYQRTFRDHVSTTREEVSTTAEWEVRWESRVCVRTGRRCSPVRNFYPQIEHRPPRSVGVSVSIWHSPPWRYAAVDWSLELTIPCLEETKSRFIPSGSSNTYSDCLREMPLLVLKIQEESRDESINRSLFSLFNDDLMTRSIESTQLCPSPSSRVRTNERTSSDHYFYFF